MLSLAAPLVANRVRICPIAPPRSGQDFPRFIEPSASCLSAHCAPAARWTRALNAPGGDALRVAWPRAAIFIGFWLMISGRALADLPIGLAAAAAATWTSLRLLPPGESRIRPLALARLALRFVRQSAIAGFDVACRALDPKLPLRPGFVAYPLHIPPGEARNAFCAFSSLLPGTLPAGAGDNGALIIHCLDVSQPVAANLAAEEALFMRAAGHE